MTPQRCQWPLSAEGAAKYGHPECGLGRAHDFHKGHLPDGDYGPREWCRDDNCHEFATGEEEA